MKKLSLTKAQRKRGETDVIGTVKNGMQLIGHDKGGRQIWVEYKHGKTN